MASVKCFVHKQTPEQLKDNGAIISGIDKVSCTHICVHVYILYKSVCFLCLLSGTAYGTCQKECNKRAAAALENMAAFTPLFYHQKCHTLMAKRIAAPFAVKMRRVRRITARLAKSAAIPYPRRFPHKP